MRARATLLVTVPLLAVSLAGCVFGPTNPDDDLSSLYTPAGTEIGINFSPSAPLEGDEITFLPASSRPPNPAGYTWTFGDGSPESHSMPSVKHTYWSHGTYRVTIKIITQEDDFFGAVDVTVDERPTGKGARPPASSPVVNPPGNETTSGNDTANPVIAPIKFALFLHNGITHGTQDMEGQEEDVHLGDAGFHLLEDISKTIESAGFKRENMRFLYDDGQIRDGDGRTEKVTGPSPYPAATRANFKTALAQIIAGANARPGSEILLFMEDHGNAYLDDGRVGSYICLQVPGKHQDCDALYDRELAELLKPLKSSVPLGLMISCSFCGGFVDKIYGPVEEPSAGVTGPGRIVSVSDSIVTECFSNTQTGHLYFQEWHEGARSGDADGWGPADNMTNDVPMGLPAYTEPDKRVSLQEAYWWATNALNQANFGLSTECGFQIDDQLGSPFIVAIK
ncbi:MAG: PKD domain-containing protein [Euryarchaeota archaeon]|nr:PKD domain-containing protein [Euryarchaeota archaeon]